MGCLSNVQHPKKKILFLGYDETQTSIINALVASNCTVYHTDKRVDGDASYDFVVSYGYRHILTPDDIAAFSCPIFNLHIAYLPFNHGAHPNFWSFYENTPSGVTLHLIDDDVDTGPIVAPRYVNFKKQDDTFVKTYAVLVIEIERLFFG